MATYSVHYLSCLCAFVIAVQLRWCGALSCYTQHNGDYWKLVFEDYFEGETTTTNLSANWQIHSAVFGCTSPENVTNLPLLYCPTDRNVHLLGDFLVLTTSVETLHDKSVTGAIITSRRHFTYGRYEIRAAQPLGSRIRTRMITRDTRELHWAIGGQINIATNVQDGYIYSDVLHKDAHELMPNVVNSERVYFPNSEAKPQPFHVYGMEWNPSGVRFFFDDRYDDWLYFNASMGLIAPHQIQLQMGFGGFAYENHEANAEELDWTCPAFIIDYIRVYKKVESQVANLSDCAQRKMKQKNVDPTVLAEICSQTMHISLWTKIYRARKPILIVASILITTTLITLLIIKIRSMKMQIMSDQNQLSVLNPEALGHIYEQYENVYECPIYSDLEDKAEQLCGEAEEKKICQYLELSV